MCTTYEKVEGTTGELYLTSMQLVSARIGDLIFDGEKNHVARGRVSDVASNPIHLIGNNLQMRRIGI